MINKLLDKHFGKKVIAIVGISKNSGKTTFLNWLVKRNPNIKIAVTTTGRDGEDFDLLTGHNKPKVALPKNVIFTTFSEIINNQASHVKVLKKIPFQVIGKDLWLCETLHYTQTEIIGPVTCKEHNELISIFHDYECEIVLIDGSIDRKSICLSDKITHVVLVIGASFGNLEEIKKRSKKIYYLSKIPKINIPDYECITYNNYSTNLKTIFGNENFINEILNKKPDWIYIPGSITNSSWNLIKNNFYNNNTTLIVNHPINIDINTNHLFDIIAKNKIQSRIPFSLEVIAVNSNSPNNEHIDVDVLIKEIENIFYDIPVIDVTKA